MRLALNEIYFSMPEGLRERYQYFTQADMTRLRKAGYQEQEDRFKEYVATYVKNVRPHVRRRQSPKVVSSQLGV